MKSKQTSFLDESTVTVKSKKKETEYTVVKRNGTLVPFRRDRILRAIEAAFRDTKKIRRRHFFQRLKRRLRIGGERDFGRPWERTGRGPFATNNGNR